MLGRVKRGSSKDDLLSFININGSLNNTVRSQETQKLINGDSTYTFLMQNVTILNHSLTTIIFVDITQ